MHDEVALQPWETAQLGLRRNNNRLARQGIQQACAGRLAQSLNSKSISNVCSVTDKLFCSAWLDHNNVLVGSKCNKLRMHHVPTGTWQEVPYPEQPIHRQGPDLLARSNRAHAGQHGMSLSPSGSFLVTGATAAEDILLWRLQDTSTSSSGPLMQPVQTFMGHADWVFGMDWISDRHWVSGGRDGTIKLWQVPDAAAQAQYSTDPGSALLSVGFHAGKVRAIKFDQQAQQVSLATDETLSWWTPDLQLKGSVRLTNAMEAVTVATCGDLIAVGSADKVQLLDTRAPNGGIQRSSSSSSIGFKRSRVSSSSGAHMDATWDQYIRTAAAAGLEAGADEVQSASLQQNRHALWRVQPNCLPPAYRPDSNRPVQPVVLAVAGPVQGMQELQRTCAAAGIDPMLAEQALRREAAAAAVSRGRSFDSALEGIISRLSGLRPQQQLQELTAMQQRSSTARAPPPNPRPVQYVPRSAAPQYHQPQLNPVLLQPQLRPEDLPPDLPLHLHPEILQNQQRLLRAMAGDFVPLPPMLLLPGQGMPVAMAAADVAARRQAALDILQQQHQQIQQQLQQHIAGQGGREIMALIEQQQQQQGGEEEDWEGSEFSGEDEEEEYLDDSDAEQDNWEDWMATQQQQQQQQVPGALQGLGGTRHWGPARPPAVQPPIVHGPDGFVYGPEGYVYGSDGRVYPAAPVQPPAIHAPNGFVYPAGAVQPPLDHGPDGFVYAPHAAVQRPLLHGPNGFLYPPGGAAAAAGVPGLGGAAAAGGLPLPVGNPRPPQQLPSRRGLRMSRVYGSEQARGAPPDPEDARISNDMRILMERMQPNSHLAMNGNPLPQELMQQRGSVLSGVQFQQQARAAGMLIMDGRSAVRSVSIQHGHLLGVGHSSLDFFDLRYIRGNHVDIFQMPPDSSLLLRRIDAQVERGAAADRGFATMFGPVSPAVYTHCWDRSGTRVVAAGGSLALGSRGAFMQLLM